MPENNKKMNIANQANPGSQEKNQMQVYLDSIQYRVVRSKEEMQDAYALVYSEYLKRGYVGENSSKLHLSAHNILPDTTTFIALSEGEVLATATVIPDSKLGLPMDALYKKEMDILRQDNKICEISMLASNTSLFKEGTPLMLNARKMFLVYYLFKHILDYVAEFLQLDYLCIAINPKHEMTYKNLLFEDLGPLKHYGKVNGAPALGKCLNLKTVEEKCENQNRSNIYKMFFAKKTVPESFTDKMAFTLEDLQYFFAKKSNILSKCSMEEINYIETFYPQYDFAKILPQLKLSRSVQKLKKI